MTRIVVGVDGSECSQRALEWALDEARRRDAQLDVVHVWQFPLLAYGMIPPVAFDSSDLEAAAQQTLDRIVSSVPHGSIAVEGILVQGTPAETLLDVARGADLLVVGSRGRGGFTGLLLGSVSQAVAHHARCPVVIVRPDDPDVT